MKHKICHVYHVKRETHGLPFVVCARHYEQACIDYGDPAFDLRVICETDAICEPCSREDKIRAPLEVLERHSGTLSDEDMLTLCRAIGYPSIKEAWMQLKVLNEDKRQAFPY